MALDWGIIGVILTILFGFVTIVAFIFGVIMALPSFMPYVSDKIPLIKKLNYLIIDKSFKVKIGAVRKYPNFNENINILKQKIINDYQQVGKKVVVPNYSKNSIQILIDDYQSPYQIKFLPDISDDDTVEGKEVSIELLGTVEFHYRGDNKNKKYIDTIEELYNTIEITFNIVPYYKNVNLIYTLTDFEEKWENIAPKKEGKTSMVQIGKKVIHINSKNISPIYDIYKKYITFI